MIAHVCHNGIAYFHAQIQDAFLSHSLNQMIGHIIVIVVYWFVNTLFLDFIMKIISRIMKKSILTSIICHSGKNLFKKNLLHHYK